MNITHSQKCRQKSRTNIGTVTCNSCTKCYHSRCYNFKKKAGRFNRETWLCNNCNKPIKCPTCAKRINNNHLDYKCVVCNNFFHKKCGRISTENSDHWHCQKCLLKELPFNLLDDNSFNLTLKAKILESESLQLLPSFSVKTLLDKLPGQIELNFHDDLLGSFSSKYYTPDEFIRAKIPKNCLSIFHLNINSLQKNIDELKNLLGELQYVFDLLTISETRIIKDKKITTNIKIDGYEFINTPTESMAGGVGIYVKNGIDYDIIPSISLCEPKIAESIFIEIRNKKRKNIIVGTVYRHPSTELNNFTENF